MKKLKSKNGITLIALIITIIILLILAMVTINILINQGIIGPANNAVRGYEVAEEKELISLAYQNYKMDNLGPDKKDFDMTAEDAKVVRDEDVNGWYITFNKTQHHYTLSENGTVEEAGERWVKNADGSYTKGDATIKIGDYIGYDHTKDANGNAVSVQEYTSYSVNNASADKNEGRTSGTDNDQKFDVNSYTKGWRVLGIKNGIIQLISADIVQPDSGGREANGNQYYSLRGQKGYIYGIEELNAIASIYGKGKGATKARSINVEDVNQITGYDPLKTGTGEVANKGEVWEYGNKVTYNWANYGTSIRYSGTNGKRGTGSRTIFNYYDEDSNTISNGVRPIVTLSPDVKIKTDATHDGSSAAKAFLLEM